MTRGNEGEPLAEFLYARLHPLMSWLAAVFVLVVVGDAIVRDEGPFATVFTVAGWIIWAIFVLEFVARLVLADSTAGFLRSNWWQVAFLVLPFLALFRFLMALRVARAGRLLSAAVRGTRSATTHLRSRLRAIAAVTVMVVLLSANVLFEFGEVHPYALALHDAALAAVTGEPISGTSGAKQIMDVLLGLYSVIVFATVAGALGAFFLGKQAEERKST
jgi:voltage-gated potassium channel